MQYSKNWRKSSLINRNYRVNHYTLSGKTWRNYRVLGNEVNFMVVKVSFSGSLRYCTESKYTSKEIYEMNETSD